MMRREALGALAGAYDLVVVGAGPAGLAAAAEGAGLGLSVLLLDEKSNPGGQIFAGLDGSPLPPGSILGADYWAGTRLLAMFDAASLDYLPSATVWELDPDRVLHVSHGGISRRIAARAVILATGAQERPMPLPGWTLPGVMTVGAAQLALKTAGLVPAGRAVLAGQGPLLWLFAAQLVAAGRPPAALLDLMQRPPLHRLLPLLPAFLRSDYARKGAELLATVRRNVVVVSGARDLRIEPGAPLTLCYRTRGGTPASLEADAVFLHQGVVPSLNLSRASGCALAWDDEQACWRPAVDVWGATSREGVAVAGDGAGIGGAAAAERRGRLAALNAAHRLGAIDLAARDRAAAADLAWLAANARARRFVDRLYCPAPAQRRGTPEAIVCRCEEVAGARLREVARATGAAGPNQIKAYLRCGMGPCQGRFCGLTVNEIIAEARGVSPAVVELLRLRPPVKPVTMAEFAAMDGA